MEYKNSEIISKPSGPELLHGLCLYFRVRRFQTETIITTFHLFYCLFDVLLPRKPIVLRFVLHEGKFCAAKRAYLMIANNSNNYCCIHMEVQSTLV